jgi:hypothetical protein
MVPDCPQPRDKDRIHANRDVCGPARLPLSGLDRIGLDEMVLWRPSVLTPRPAAELRVDARQSRRTHGCPLP